MPALTTYTKPLTPEQAERLRALLTARDFDFQPKPYCLYAASRPGVNVLVYEKGPKVVVQGKGTEDFVTMLLEPQVLGVAEVGYEEVHHPERFAPHLGIDESGKGDFFGPLVIAGAYVDGDIAKQLQAAGVMDSKRISSDARISALARQIKATRGLAYEVIVIGPQRYNELYGKFGNLNRLLAWGHARVIENLLTRCPDCPQAISDQFANPAVLQRALGERGKTIELIQRTKAESDPAVAAASILARDAFVQWLREQGEKLGVELPKGASSAVVATAQSLAQSLGSEALTGIAKMHFRTAAQALGGEPQASLGD